MERLGQGLPSGASDADVVAIEAQAVDECPRLPEPLYLFARSCGLSSLLEGMVCDALGDEYRAIDSALEGIDLASLGPAELASLDLPRGYLKHLVTYATPALHERRALELGRQDASRVRVMVRTGLVTLEQVAKRIGVGPEELEGILAQPSGVDGSSAELATRARRAAYAIVSDRKGHVF